MTNFTEDKIKNILSTVKDIHTDKDLVSSDNVKSITIDDEIVNVELLLKYPAINYHEDLKGSVEEALSKACLLYTSPSPRDVEESRMPSSA